MILGDRKPTLIQESAFLYNLLIAGQMPIFILGTNETTTQLIDTLKLLNRSVKAVINDYGGMREFYGHPVIKTEDVPKEALVVSCSTAVNPVSAVRRLKNAGIDCVLDYFTLYISGQGTFAAPKFCAENIADVEAHRDRYEWVESLLTDEESKVTFQRLLEFRFNFDLSAMASFRTRLDAQYFEPFVELSKGEVFVDAGGFDGQTTETFICKCPSYRQVHYFEPDPKLIALSKKRLQGSRNIEFHEAALSDRNGEVTFNQTGTGSGSVCADGRLRVRTSRLDDLQPEPAPTFIKLDIEGAEFTALAGGEAMLKKTRPKLAVCIYHRQSDFWRIPEKVLSVYSGYRVYVRHYTEGIEETVMYFL
jgi:FkbM family methyltransferase